MGSLYSEYTSWLHAWSAGRKLLLMALLGTGLFLIDSPWLLAMAGAACGLPCRFALPICPAELPFLTDSENSP